MMADQKFKITQNQNQASVCKIALFVGSMWPGGATTFVLDLGVVLIEAGHAVTVVTCAHGAWWHRLAENGIKGVCLPCRKWESTVGHVRRLADYLIAERFDIVFLNNGLGVQPAMLGVHFWPDAMSAILVLHNDLARVYGHAHLNKSAWNAAVAVSPKVQRIARVHLPDKPVLHISYGIHLPTENQLQARLAWSLPLRLLFVGRLHDAHKGILRLPEIVAACRKENIPVMLTVIGAGVDLLPLMRKIGQCEVTDLIVLRGMLPAEEVYGEMQNHHILLMPSNYEGLPLVSLEAQANGCVPIASRLPGITDIAIEHGVSGWLAEVEDIDDFVRHIAGLLDAECWRCFSQAGVDRARRFFSTTVMGARYLELIKQVVAGSYPLAAPRSQIRHETPAFFLLRDHLPNWVRRGLGRLHRYWRGHP